MAITPADLTALSRLLDQAMELDGNARAAWMTALPEADRHLEPMLREMLAERDSARTSGFLSSMPELPDQASTSVEVAQTGELVGAYRLIREIGRGGMGSVWLAERADGSFKRRVALKLPRLAWGAGLAERMAREREIGALLEHPNIARLYDAGVDERGRPFLALEYIDGVQIDAWRKDKALPVRERLKLIVQVARAVSYAHGRLVVHRDLKPSNVLVTPDAQTHLLDFGIAKLLHDAAPGEIVLTQEQGRVLTPHYASPEQMRGETITVQSDVYSLGVLTYELLTGNTPYKPARKTLAALEEVILEGEPELASSRTENKVTARSLRGEVDTILSKALRREPSQRYATADAFANDIERHLAGERVLAQPDSVRYRLRKTLARHRLGFTATAAVLAAVIAGVSLTTMQARRARDSAERERTVKAFVADVFRVNMRNTGAGLGSSPMSADPLVEESAKLIQTRFAAQPELQAELYGVVGRAFSDMGAHRLAIDYATKQTETLKLLHAKAIDQASATLMLAQAMLEEGRLNNAEPQALRGLELAKGDELLTMNALALLARVQITSGKFEPGAATLDRLETQLLAGVPAPSAPQAWAIALRAETLQKDNLLGEAYPVYNRAINVALAAEGPLSDSATAIRLMAARWYRQTGDLQKVDALFEPAISTLRSRGGPHAVRASVEVARNWWHLYGAVQAVPFAAARDGIESARRELEARGNSVPRTLLAQVDVWLGSLLTEWGAVEAGGQLMDSGGPLLLASIDDPLERMWLTAILGESTTWRGLHDRADSLWRESLEMRKAAGRGRHPYALNSYTGIAINLGMAGRYAEAEDVLRGAPHLEPWRDEGVNPELYNNSVLEALARVRLDSGDPAGAMDLLPK